MTNPKTESLDTTGQERAVIPLIKEALDLARPYVVDAVRADGGINDCDISLRIDLEKIEAASKALSTLPHQPAAGEGDFASCPFCGGAKVHTFGPYGWYRQWGISHSCQSFYSGTSEMMQGFHTEAAAVEAWNTRGIILSRLASQPTSAEDAWVSVEQKFYRSEWSLHRLLEARNGGLATDDGEAWHYVYSSKDGTGGEYDMLRRRVPASRPTPDTQTAAIGAEAMREAFAKVADGHVMSGNDQWSVGYDAAARKIARDIRSATLS